MPKVLLTEFGKVKIDKNGNWFHNDSKFTHEGVIKIFNENLIKDIDNKYFVKFENGNNILVEVEDVAIWVIDIDIFEKESKIVFYLSNFTNSSIDKSNEDFKIETDKSNENFYCNVNGWKTKFSRNMYNFLLNYVIEKNDNYFITIGNLTIPIIQK